MLVKRTLKHHAPTAVLCAILVLAVAPALSDDPCDDARLQTTKLVQTLQKHSRQVVPAGRFLTMQKKKKGVPMQTQVSYVTAEQWVFNETLTTPIPRTGRWKSQQVQRTERTELDLKYFYGAAAGIRCHYRIIFEGGAFQMSKVADEDAAPFTPHPRDGGTRTRSYRMGKPENGCNKTANSSEHNKKLEVLGLLALHSSNDCSGCITTPYLKPEYDPDCKLEICSDVHAGVDLRAGNR